MKGARGRGTKQTEKVPILGMIQRGGYLVMEVVDNVKQKTIEPLIKERVAKGSTTFTDEYNIYARLQEWGYKHQTVNHGKGEYARDEDGDGFDNKTEFLFGGNPLSSLSTPAITYFKDDQDQEFSASLYVQDSAQEGNFSWQWARDLTTGSWFTSGFEQTDTDIPNGMIRSQILLDTSQEPQVFLRGIFE